MWVNMNGTKVTFILLWKWQFEIRSSSTRADPGLSKGGTNECRRCKLSWGVWGHAPPDIFENLSL